MDPNMGNSCIQDRRGRDQGKWGAAEADEPTSEEGFYQSLNEVQSHRWN